MAKKKRGKKSVKTPGGLEGLDIQINEMGEVISNVDITKINRFLDENTSDKKLAERDKKKESESDE